MDRKDVERGLYRYCAGLKPVNSHCHHLRDGEHAALGLDGLLQHSYVSWYHLPVPRGPGGRGPFLNALRGSSYLYWLEASLRKLYGIGEALSDASWDRFDEAVRQAHRDPEHHLRLLRDACGYAQVVNDSFWDPGSDEGHGGFFTPALRVNMFFFGYSPSARDHNGNNPFAAFGWDAGMGFFDYVDAVEGLVRNKAAAGCVALKSALAYDRGNDFCETSAAAAAKGYRNPSAGPEDIKAFQDFLFFRLCALAGELGLVFQNHTGLGKLSRSGAIHLLEAVEKHPGTRFSLFHGSYPWTGDLAGLVHNHGNVIADLCWLPLISPSACERLLVELLEVGGGERLMWGCDTQTGEESFGALLAIASVLAKAFSRLVCEGALSAASARDRIERVLCGNAREAFGGGAGAP